MTAEKSKSIQMWDGYVSWLFDNHVDIPKYYNMMLYTLMDVPWSWTRSHDSHSTMHAYNIRSEYASSRYDMYDAFESPKWTELHKALDPMPVVFLEALVALSIQMELNGGKAYSHQWARVLLDNLGLLEYRGNLTHKQVIEVCEIAERCIWRRYEPDGRGGFFPLRDPKEDQRHVDLWSQLLAYLREYPNGPSLKRLSRRL